jgi:glycosyltransferase involved in cell wall biosynthesis
MGNQPTLSVLMPNYNHAHFLPESLGAIISQSFRPEEILVLDDASTDNSVQVIEEFACKEPRLRLIRNERNMGVNYGVNKLLECASSEYVYLPSADDKVLPGFFEKSISLLAKYPQAGLCSTVGRLIGEKGDDRGIRAIPVISSTPHYFSPEETLRVLRRYGRWIDSGSVIFRREALVKEGKFREELGSFSDTFINLVIALRYGVCFVPEPLHCWRLLSTGYATRSGNDWVKLLERGEIARDLMRTQYKDIFPPDYISIFFRQWMYLVTICAGFSVFDKHRQNLDEVFQGLSLQTKGINRIFRFSMCKLISIQAIGWRGYSMLKYGTWRWWLLGRFSILRNFKKVIIRETLES